MSLHPSLVVDVFTYEGQAKHALEALRHAGFAYDQIGIAMQGHEGIDLLSDLQNLGVSYEQASYYTQEVKAGHTVVSVRPDGREQEAHEIMQRSGAFTNSESGASQTSIDKQRALWEQAVASHQAYLAEQLASQTQEDFHQPRSLKPRAERLPLTTSPVQTEETELHPTMGTQQKSGVASLAPQNDEDTEQRPIVTPAGQQSSVAPPVVQSAQVSDQLSLVEDDHRETTPSDDEEALRPLTNWTQDSANALLPQTQPQKYRNGALAKKGVLTAGVLLGLGIGALVGLQRREHRR